jgi:hypothetical protein
MKLSIINEQNTSAFKLSVCRRQPADVTESRVGSVLNMSSNMSSD